MYIYTVCIYIYALAKREYRTPSNVYMHVARRGRLFFSSELLFDQQFAVLCVDGMYELYIVIIYMICKFTQLHILTVETY
jgi:hypothetical protein